MNKSNSTTGLHRFFWLALAAGLSIAPLHAATAEQITGIKPVDNIEVPFQTSYEDAMGHLPTAVELVLGEGDTVATQVEWKLDQPYFPTTYGNYTAIGTLELPDGISQSEPAIPLEVTTTLRVNSGRGLMVLNWEGFNQPGRYIAETIDLGGEEGQKIYHYYLPTSYDPAQPIPVLFDLHGGGSNGLAQWSSSRSDRYAEKEGFISIAPNDHTPNFVEAILDRMESLYNIDTKRVYSMGVSMGGMGTTRVGTALPDRIAGMGIVSGNFLLSRMRANGDKLPRPMPVILIGGTKESTSGAPFRDIVPSMLEDAQWLADQTGCKTKAEVQEIESSPDNLDLDELPLWTSREDARTIQQHYPTSAIIHTWTDCTNGYEITAYGIQGGGHVWPGGNQFVVETTVGPATHIIDATEVIWEHLSRYTLP